MCSTVIFQYRCGCAERVVFECPFSSTTDSVSGENLHQHPRQNCSQRHRHKLFPSKMTTSAANIPSSHQALSSRPKIPVLPPPTLLYPEIGETREEQEASEATTALDEACHDCWQRSLRLARQGDDDEEGMGDLANSRVLREISANRVILPPPRTNSGATLSTERSSSTGQA
ncbi:hypothetical protein F5B18DRAFT_647727 [Nemania serpens]|nr:hypothetical protein F5B18DRAFT_647727 [Nemania serpens]